MKREIEKCTYSVEPIDDAGEEFAANPKDWLAAKAKEHGLDLLLAHADDGVIWGKMMDGKLRLSSNVFPGVSPLLRAITLQQIRLFGEQAELLIWREGDKNWRGRLLVDHRGGERKGWCFNEAQLQWGDRWEEEKEGFTLVCEGQEGLRHAVPLSTTSIPFDPPEKKRDRWHPLRLGVRQYLERDEDGTLVIVQGRLTGLWAEGRKGDSDE